MRQIKAVCYLVLHADQCGKEGGLIHIIESGHLGYADGGVQLQVRPHLHILHITSHMRDVRGMETHT